MLCSIKGNCRIYNVSHSYWKGTLLNEEISMDLTGNNLYHYAIDSILTTNEAGVRD